MMRVEAIEENATKCGIPAYMVGGIVRWIVNGIPPGDFLTAVLSNDLKGACERADDTNQHLLFIYCNFFYNYAPSQCWGSPEKVLAWKLKMELKASGVTI